MFDMSAFLAVLMPLIQSVIATMMTTIMASLGSVVTVTERPMQFSAPQVERFYKWAKVHTDDEWAKGHFSPGDDPNYRTWDWFRKYVVRVVPFYGPVDYWNEAPAGWLEKAEQTCGYTKPNFRCLADQLNAALALPRHPAPAPPTAKGWAFTATDIADFRKSCLPENPIPNPRTPEDLNAMYGYCISKKARVLVHSHFNELPWMSIAEMETNVIGDGRPWDWDRNYMSLQDLAIMCGFGVTSAGCLAASVNYFYYLPVDGVS